MLEGFTFQQNRIENMWWKKADAPACVVEQTLFLTTSAFKTGGKEKEGTHHMSKDIYTPIFHGVDN
jgi:hypothetical protein